MAKKIFIYLIPLLCLLSLLLIVLLKQEGNTSCRNEKYYHNEGYVFGTYYNIRYQAERDLEPDIEAAFKAFDNSLSMFNAQSTLSKINRNESLQTDSLFDIMYQTANEISTISHGAFDITVRPLVNAWGFGTNKSGRAEQKCDIDSIRNFVGYQKISLNNGILNKEDERITLDASAIAKGYGVDVIANLIASQGSKNYLVDIGGEVVAEGVNSRGEAWRVGICQPDDDPDGTNTKLQSIIETTHIAMATSGNYRQFYMDGAVRRSHTIDPRSGYPVQHSLLSATVIAESCMRADALATACMVLGAEEALQMIEQIEDAACYLILAEEDHTKVLKSTNFDKKCK